MESKIEFWKCLQRNFQRSRQDSIADHESAERLLSMASMDDDDWTSAALVVEGPAAALTAFVRALFDCSADASQEFWLPYLWKGITKEIHKETARVKANPASPYGWSIYWSLVVTVALQYAPARFLFERFLTSSKQDGEGAVTTADFVAQYLRSCHIAARKWKAIDEAIAQRLAVGRDGCVQRLSKIVALRVPAPFLPLPPLHTVLASVDDFMLLMRTLFTSFSKACKSFQFATATGDDDVANVTFVKVDDEEMNELLYCEILQKTQAAVGAASKAHLGVEFENAGMEAEADKVHANSFDGVAAAVFRSPYSVLSSLADRIVAYACHGECVLSAAGQVERTVRHRRSAAELSAVQREVVQLLATVAETPYVEGDNKAAEKLDAKMKRDAERAVDQIDNVFGRGLNSKAGAGASTEDTAAGLARFERLAKAVETSCAKFCETDAALQLASLDNLPQELLKAFARRNPQRQPSKPHRRASPSKRDARESSTSEATSSDGWQDSDADASSESTVSTYDFRHLYASSDSDDDDSNNSDDDSNNSDDDSNNSDDDSSDSDDDSSDGSDEDDRSDSDNSESDDDVNSSSVASSSSSWAQHNRCAAHASLTAALPPKCSRCLLRQWLPELSASELETIVFDDYAQMEAYLRVALDAAVRKLARQLISTSEHIDALAALGRQASNARDAEDKFKNYMKGTFMMAPVRTKCEAYVRAMLTRMSTKGACGVKEKKFVQLAGGQRCYVVSGFDFSLSTVKSAVTAAVAAADPPDYVFVVSEGHLVLDTGLTLPGVSVCLTAASISVCPAGSSATAGGEEAAASQTIVIDTSGRRGKDGAAGTHGIRGAKRTDGKLNGKSGTDGESGEPGQSAGDVLIQSRSPLTYASTSVRLRVVALGGAGGSGGAAGNGGNGAAADDADDQPGAPYSTIKAMCYGGCSTAFTFAIRGEYAKKMPGKGGNTGQAGAAGLPGRGGRIVVRPTDKCRQSALVSSNGAAGGGGGIGTPGEAGRGGCDGRAYCGNAEYNGFFCTNFDYWGSRFYGTKDFNASAIVGESGYRSRDCKRCYWSSSSPMRARYTVRDDVDKSVEFVNNGVYYRRAALKGNKVKTVTGTREVDAQLPYFDEVVGSNAVLAALVEKAVGTYSFMKDCVQAVGTSDFNTTDEEAAVVDVRLDEVEEFLRADLREVFALLHRTENLTTLLAERAPPPTETITMVDFTSTCDDDDNAADEGGAATAAAAQKNGAVLLDVFARVGSSSGKDFDLMTLPFSAFLVEHKEAIARYHAALQDVKLEKKTALFCLLHLSALLRDMAASPRPFVVALSSLLSAAMEGTLPPRLLTLKHEHVMPLPGQLACEAVLCHLGDNVVWRMRVFHHARLAVEELAASPQSDTLQGRMLLAKAREKVETLLVCPAYLLEETIETMDILPLSPLLKPQREAQQTAFSDAYEQLSSSLYGACFTSRSRDSALLRQLDSVCADYVSFWQQCAAVVDADVDEVDVMVARRLVDVYKFLRGCVAKVPAAAAAKTAAMNALTEIPDAVEKALRATVNTLAGQRRRLFLLHAWCEVFERERRGAEGLTLHPSVLFGVLVEGTQFRIPSPLKEDEDALRDAVVRILRYTRATDRDMNETWSISNKRFADNFKVVRDLCGYLWTKCNALRKQKEDFIAEVMGGEASPVPDRSADLAEAVYYLTLCRKLLVVAQLHLQSLLLEVQARAAAAKVDAETTIPLCFCQYENFVKGNPESAAAKASAESLQSKFFVGPLPCLACEQRCRTEPKKVPVSGVRAGNEIAFLRFLAAFLPRWMDTLAYHPEQSLTPPAKLLHAALCASYDASSETISFERFCGFPKAADALKSAEAWLSTQSLQVNASKDGVLDVFTLPIASSHAAFPSKEDSAAPTAPADTYFTTAPTPHAAATLQALLGDGATAALRHLAQEVGSDALHDRLATWLPFDPQRREEYQDRINRWDAQVTLEALCSAAYSADDVIQCNLSECAKVLCSEGSLATVKIVIDKMQREKEASVDCADGAFVVYPELLRYVLELLAHFPLTLDPNLYAVTQQTPMVEWLKLFPRLAYAVSLRLWAPQHAKSLEELCWAVGLEAGEDHLMDFVRLVRSWRAADVTGPHLRALLVAPPGLCLPAEKIRIGLTQEPPQWSATVAARYDAVRQRRMKSVAAFGKSPAAQKVFWASIELDWDGIVEYLRVQGTVLPDAVLSFSRDVYAATHALLTSFTSYSSAAVQARMKRFAQEHLKNAYTHAASKQRTSVAEVEAREAALWRDDLPKVKEVLLTIFLAFYQDRYKPYKVQVLAVVALLFHGSSCLANINTGEGKTYIGGCVVAFKAYLGYTALLLSSNDALAKEAMLEHQAPLKLLLEGAALPSGKGQLPPSCFLDPAAPRRTAMYAHKILYGTLTTVIGDHLHALLHPGNHPEVVQYNRNPRWVLADEADVPMVSSFSDAVYIGDERVDFAKELLGFPALLRSAFIGDEDKVAFEKYFEAVAKVCFCNEEACLSETTFRVLLKSATTAITARNNAQFVSADGTTMPYDLSTGSTMWGTIWRDGVSALINLKEGRRFIPEKDSTVAMASLIFFQGLKGKLTAITGTAGNHLTRLVYKREYGLSTCMIPPAFPSQMLELLPVVTFSKKAFEQRVVASVTRALGEKQSVLLVQNTIGEVTEMHKLMQSSFPGVRTGCYSLEEDARPQLTGSEQAIFCATQRGGRGMDIRINTPHGLHVILCSPQDERNTYQAERRAARRYDCGTSQRIFLLRVAQDPFLLNTVTELPASAAKNESGHYYSGSDGKRSDDQVARLNAFYAVQNRATATERARLLRLIHHDAPVTRFRDELQEVMWARHEQCAAVAADKDARAMLLRLLLCRYVEWMARKERDIDGQCDRRRAQLVHLAELRSVLNSVVAEGGKDAPAKLSAAEVAKKACNAEERLYLALALNYDVGKMAAIFSDDALSTTKDSSARKCVFGTTNLYSALLRVVSVNGSGVWAWLDSKTSKVFDEKHRPALNAIRKDLAKFQDRVGTWMRAHEGLRRSLEEVQKLMGTATSLDKGCLKQINDMILFEQQLCSYVSKLIGQRGKASFRVLGVLYNAEKPSTARECLQLAEVLLKAKVLIADVATFTAGNVEKCVATMFTHLKLSSERCETAAALQKRLLKASATHASRTMALWSVLCDVTASAEEAHACMETAVELKVVRTLDVHPDLLHLHNEECLEKVEERLKGTAAEGIAATVTGALISLVGVLRQNQLSYLGVAAVTKAVPGLSDTTLVTPFRIYGFHQIVAVEEHKHCAKVREQLAEAERKRNSIWGKIGRALSWLARMPLISFLWAGLDWMLSYFAIYSLVKDVLLPFVKQAVLFVSEWMNTGKWEWDKHFKAFGKAVFNKYVMKFAKTAANWIKETPLFKKVTSSLKSIFSSSDTAELSSASTAASAKQVASASATQTAQAAAAVPERNWQTFYTSVKEKTMELYAEEIVYAATDMMTTKSQSGVEEALNGAADLLASEVLLLLRSIKAVKSMSDYSKVSAAMLAWLDKEEAFLDLKRIGCYVLSSVGTEVRKATLEELGGKQHGVALNTMFSLASTLTSNADAAKIMLRDNSPMQKKIAEIVTKLWAWAAKEYGVKTRNYAGASPSPPPPSPDEQAVLQKVRGRLLKDCLHSLSRIYGEVSNLVVDSLYTNLNSFKLHREEIQQRKREALIKEEAYLKPTTFLPPAWGPPRKPDSPFAPSGGRGATVGAPVVSPHTLQYFFSGGGSRQREPQLTRQLSVSLLPSLFTPGAGTGLHQYATLLYGRCFAGSDVNEVLTAYAAGGDAGLSPLSSQLLKPTADRNLSSLDAVLRHIGAQQFGSRLERLDSVAGQLQRVDAYRRMTSLQGVTAKKSGATPALHSGTLHFVNEDATEMFSQSSQRVADEKAAAATLDAAVSKLMHDVSVTCGGLRDGDRIRAALARQCDGSSADVKDEVLKVYDWAEKYTASARARTPSAKGSVSSSAQPRPSAGKAAGSSFPSVKASPSSFSAVPQPSASSSSSTSKAKHTDPSTDKKPPK